MRQDPRKSPVPASARPFDVTSHSFGFETAVRHVSHLNGRQPTLSQIDRLGQSRFRAS